VGGWAGLALDVAIPAIFFLVMCLPKHYVKPQRTPLQLSPLYDLDAPSWGFVYQGTRGAFRSAVCRPRQPTTLCRFCSTLRRAAPPAPRG
jgi:hypothetical protein